MNKIYHVLKREFGDSTHYSELPIIFEGSYKDCSDFVYGKGFKFLCHVNGRDNTEVIFYLFENNNEDYEYLIA